MKAKISTKFAAMAFCLTALCFSSARAVNIDLPALTPPEGTGSVWMIGDYETAATSITTNNGFDFWVYPWAGNTSDVKNVPNPIKDAVNSSDNVMNYMTSPTAQWNGMDFKLTGDYVATKPDRMDLTGWDKFEVDVLAGPGVTIPDFGFKFVASTIGDQIVAPEFNPPMTYVGGTGITSTAWVTVSFDLSGLKDLANLQNADGTPVWPQLLQLYGHFQFTVASNIYYDNFRFVKSASTALSKVVANNVSVYPNPAVNVIKANGAKGKVDIYNVLGMKLISLTDYQGENININDLKSGSYFIKTANKTVPFIKK
jgi:hypothetical protein